MRRSIRFANRLFAQYNAGNLPALNKARTRTVLIGAALLAAITTCQAETATADAGKSDDPHGIILKPIPERLVVPTFDDGPASSCTVVAPILKSLGFGGSFYICDFDSFGGGMSGPGGFTKIGPQGGFGRVNSGWVFPWGTNTYSGTTTVCQGTLIVKRAASLYNADAAQWTASKISVAPAATLQISAGGPGEFTGAQVGTLLKNLTTSVNSNGLMARSVFCIDTANATGAVTVAIDMSDSKGPGGGAFVLKKCGAGALRLSGNNTYTGQTILEGGTLSVASLNSVVNGKGSSGLGAPANVETGEIVIGSGDGEFTLVYTGTGETSDRVMNLAGKKSTVTFDQSGTGLLKLTRTFVISGYGASKIVMLKGGTAGTGEIAGNIVNPYDRAGKATTAVTKYGTGTWTLSGTNSYTGPTTVTQGTLSLANARSLGDKTDVHLSEGAMLDLSFKGEMRIGALYLDGKLQPAGSYGAANASRFIEGKGTLKVSDR